MWRFLKRQRGITLVEILIVLAVLAILAAVVIPNVTGFLGRAKSRGYEADKQLLQSAVDGWRSDIAKHASKAWPIILGDEDCLADTPTITAECNNYIDIAQLATDGFLDGSDAVKSADTSKNTTATNSPSGSYGWFINSKGRVRSDPAFTGAYP
jgi:prepilin-type N-terminal cleavage/methylation domain-containing protein